jgi:hypothetical protein
MGRTRFIYPATQRADKGKHCMDSQWQKFIINIYKEGNREGFYQVTSEGNEAIAFCVYR